MHPLRVLLSAAVLNRPGITLDMAGGVTHKTYPHEGLQYDPAWSLQS